MKRWIAIPLLLLYFITATGMIVQLHYCGDNLSSFAINTNNADCCCADSGEQSNDCCKNEVIKAPVVSDQLASHFFLSVKKLAEVMPIALPITTIQESVTFKSAQPEQSWAHAPPNLAVQLPFYKMYGSLIFYA